MSEQPLHAAEHDRRIDYVEMAATSIADTNSRRALRALDTATERG
jgi:hypothetical protein